jgi:hypothetical protein
MSLLTVGILSLLYKIVGFSVPKNNMLTPPGMPTRYKIIALPRRRSYFSLRTHPWSMDEDLKRFRVDVGYCKSCLGMQGGREQRVYRFPNGYGASLISAPRLGGPERWTIMALRFDGDDYDTVEVPGIENGTTSDWNASLQMLNSIMSQPHF